jgi:transposase
MSRSIHLEPHLSTDELGARYRRTLDPVERSHWQFLWLLARGFTAKAIARVTGYTAYWIGQIARHYNALGPQGVKDRRRLARPHRQLLTTAQHTELRAALSGPAPQHDQWNGRTVAVWIAELLGRPICRQLGWVYLRRLGASLRMPRPRHVQADPRAQDDFKRRLRPLLSEVATAFPRAQVELWAMDEHRIGLKPILRKVWCLDGKRPLAPVQHRYEWRYLVGFVHPASGRTIFHLATSVSVPLFEAELAAFATAVGASPSRQIVLVLDRAGWHSTQRLRVPDHVHLLFLPPYSPELQPAEHLWPLTNTPLFNRHFTNIEEPEDAQAERCVALQAQRALVHATTRFHWWPQRIRTHHPRPREEQAAPTHRGSPRRAGSSASHAQGND